MNEQLVYPRAPRELPRSEDRPPFKEEREGCERAAYAHPQGAIAHTVAE